MKTLDVSDYMVLVDETAKYVPYAVRPSLIALLFAQRDLDAVALLDRDDLARKIRDVADDTLVLEDAEFAKLVTAVKTFKGYTKNDVTLVRRILDASK